MKYHAVPTVIPCRPDTDVWSKFLSAYQQAILLALHAEGILTLPQYESLTAPRPGDVS